MSIQVINEYLRHREIKTGIAIPKVKFSKSLLENLPIPKDKLYLVAHSDLSALRCCVRPTGKRILSVSRRISGGNPTSYTLGEVHEYPSLKEIELDASEAIRLMRQGVNPNQVKRDRITQIAKRKRETEAMNVTLIDAFHHYLAQSNLAATTVKNYKGNMHNHLEKEGKLRIRDVFTWDALFAIRNRIVRNTGPGAAKITLDMLSGILTHYRSSKKGYRDMLPTWPFET